MLLQFRPTGKEKPAFKISQHIYNWLNDDGADVALWMVSGDSGCRGGVVADLEKLLEPKLHWIICQIHVNELPLRNLIIKLDGPYKHKSGFRILLMIINTLQVVHNWEPLGAEKKTIELLQDIVKNLPKDTKNCYCLIKAITTGEFSEELATIKCGPLCQSRWLTTGQALLMQFFDIKAKHLRHQS